MFQCNSGAPYFCFENTARPRNSLFKRHDHSNYEIYLLDEGTCSYFIENKVYHVEKGDLILIPPHTLHKANYDEAEYERRVIWCAPQYVPQDVLAKLPSHMHLHHTPAVFPEIAASFDRIERETERADEYTDQILMHCMQVLFYTLMRGVDRYTVEQEGNPYIRHAVRYIQEHYDGTVRLSDVAREVAISAEHLSRLFKGETGFGFSEYLNVLRLQKAEEMLRESPHMRVSAVAFACGFNDSNYFCERFKQVYGCSPMQHRRNVRKGQGN